MLDSTHPITQHVFRASGLMDRVMIRGQKMSVSPSAVRAELLAECLPLFAEMRELARAQFGKRAAFILVAVDEYEAALRALGGLGGGRITEDRRDGEGACPACGTPITKFRPLPDCKGFEDHWIILCRECDKPFMEAHGKLASSDGFGTWAI
ncbi:hypothetical protein AB3662_39530 [Sorangium cellulosum]|uniref:hypothetical protein n=1 Tax=Sorangium cellulosum TaxID=56 RepID=UPI003D9A9D39